MRGLYTFDMQLRFAVLNAGQCTPLPVLTFVLEGFTSFFFLQVIVKFSQIRIFQLGDLVCSGEYFSVYLIVNL